MFLNPGAGKAACRYRGWDNQGFWAGSHASATWAGVPPLAAAIRSSRSMTARHWAFMACLAQSTEHEDCCVGLSSDRNLVVSSTLPRGSRGHQRAVRQQSRLPTFLFTGGQDLGFQHCATEWSHSLLQSCHRAGRRGRGRMTSRASQEHLAPEQTLAAADPSVGRSSRLAFYGFSGKGDAGILIEFGCHHRSDYAREGSAPPMLPILAVEFSAHIGTRYSCASPRC